MTLSDAGFFYAGFSDCTRCFSCGGGLRNWDDGDIPWIEHARWYPDCDFLRQRKGDLFIRMHRQSNDENQLPQYLPEPTRGASNHMDGEKMEKAISAETTEAEEIAARSVLEMGYSKSVIDSAVRELRNQGKSNYYATDIMEIIFSNEEGQTNTTQTNQNRCTTSQGLEAGVSVDSHSLLKENQTLKEQMICKICLDKEACMVYLPCGHMVTCQNCSSTIRKCCICRKLIQGTVRAYL